MAMLKSPVLQGPWSLANEHSEGWQCEIFSGEKNHRGGISSEESQTKQEAEKLVPMLFIIWRRAEDIYYRKIHPIHSHFLDKADITTMHRVSK